MLVDATVAGGGFVEPPPLPVPPLPVPPVPPPVLVTVTADFPAASHVARPSYWLNDIALTVLPSSDGAPAATDSTSDTSKPLPTLRSPRGNDHGGVQVPKARGTLARTPLLTDDQFNAYQLSYSAPPTYVYSAHTASTEASHYVTIVAQPDTFGTLQVALRTSTDAAHLDRTPWMRPIDVIDADASNRASLLVELRAQNSRQFALYRVIAGKADQTYVTGSTQ